jgi:hypothetical protein
MLSPDRPQKGRLLDNDGLPLPPRTRSYNELLTENKQLRRQVDALKDVIEHVDDEGKVPMAYILSAQTAIHGSPDVRRHR